MRILTFDARVSANDRLLTAVRDLEGSAVSRTVHTRHTHGPGSEPCKRNITGKPRSTNRPTRVARPLPTDRA